MKVLIVEDEELAVRKIQKTLAAVNPEAEVVGVTDSILASVNWIEENPTPDLILMDIELSDGQSFEIFNRVAIKCPVIFTTSYDEYALKAFKVNSVDYLLKPIQKEDLATALQKLDGLKDMYKSAESKSEVSIDNLVKELQQKLQPKEYRKRFLVRHAQKLVSIDTEEIAYFFSDGRLKKISDLLNLEMAPYSTKNNQDADFQLVKKGELFILKKNHHINIHIKI